MTNRYEVGLPSSVLLLEQCNRIGTTRSRRPSGVHRQRHLLTRSPPSRDSFINARVHDCRHQTLLTQVSVALVFTTADRPRITSGPPALTGDEGFGQAAP